MTTQHELLKRPQCMICGPCLAAMIPEVRNGWPIWRCPKCEATAPRKEEQTNG